MASLPACTLVVTAEIDTSVEDEWNKWYDEVHLPEALAWPSTSSPAPRPWTPRNSNKCAVGISSPPTSSRKHACMLRVRLKRLPFLCGPLGSPLRRVRGRVLRCHIWSNANEEK